MYLLVCRGETQVQSAYHSSDRYYVCCILKLAYFSFTNVKFQSEHVASRVRKARDVVYTNAVEHICGPVIEDGDQCTAPVQLLSFSSVDRDVMKAVPFSC